MYRLATAYLLALAGSPWLYLYLALAAVPLPAVGGIPAALLAGYLAGSRLVPSRLLVLPGARAHLADAAAALLLSLPLFPVATYVALLARLAATRSPIFLPAYLALYLAAPLHPALLALPLLALARLPALPHLVWRRFVVAPGPVLYLSVALVTAVLLFPEGTAAVLLRPSGYEVRFLQGFEVRAAFLAPLLFDLVRLAAAAPVYRLTAAYRYVPWRGAHRLGLALRDLAAALALAVAGGLSAALLAGLRAEVQLELALLAAAWAAAVFLMPARLEDPATYGLAAFYLLYGLMPTLASRLGLPTASAAVLAAALLLRLRYPEAAEAASALLRRVRRLP